VAGTPTVAIRAITAGVVDTRRQAAASGSGETLTSAATAAPPGGTDPTEAISPAGSASTEGLNLGNKADGDPPADEGEARLVRGPFEPLRPGEHDAAGYSDYRPADEQPAFGDHDDIPLDISGYQSLEEEIPDLLDFGAPGDPEAGALGQLTDLYLKAETISPAGLDSHFDQLLERQRQLISEYFKESGGVTSVESALLPAPPVPAAETPSAPDPPARFAPLGFDSAESVSGQP
jgi:hypothetical protein